MIETPSQPMPTPLPTPPPPSTHGPVQYFISSGPSQDRKRIGVFAGLARLLVGLIFIVSLTMNLYLLALVGKSMQGPLEHQVVSEGAHDQVMAIWKVQGMIGDQASEAFGLFAKEVMADPAVKAVVIRVDSGGGGVSSADQIYNSVKRIKAAGKKVVVSMGGVAASGGYYIAAPAEIIYAEPTTITGSIGVIAGWPVLSGTLEKIGAKMVIMRSKDAQAWKAAENPFENPAPYQLAHLQEMLNQIQEQFESIVRQGRGNKLQTRSMPASYVAADGKPIQLQDVEPFNGKVYMAAKAQQLGLVDEIGYLSDAADAAAKLAGLRQPRLVQYKQRSGLLERALLGSQAAVNIDLKSLQEMQTPRIMLQWTEQ